MNLYLCLILIILLADFIWGQTLSALNRSRMSPHIPKELEGIYKPSEYTKQQLYQKTNSRFGLISGGFSFLLILAVLGFGLLGWLDESIRVHTMHYILLPLTFFGILLLVNEVLDLPFDWISVFRIEERFGFNKSTPRIFVTDWIKGTLLNILIGGIILTLIIVIYHYTAEWFWLLAWLIITLFSLIMSFFYSEWIVPLFNKQTPLEEGKLRTAIENFANKANFQLDSIYLMDGSKRSTKANAYFTGFGKKKRVVLFDTLLDELNTEEIVAVLAHEIGHYKKKHIIQSMILSILTTGATLYILSLFLNNTQLAEALGGKQASFHLGLIGFGLLFSPISECLGLLMNIISRKNEYEADAFAAQYGLGEALISALKKISVNSLSNLNPHPWVVFWGYSHPTLLQRVKNLKM